MVLEVKPMKRLFYLASEIQELFVKENWRFCFIGGIALQRWGEPRLTLDVDISLLTGFENEAYFIDILCRKYPSRIENADAFALRNRVLLLKSEENIPIVRQHEKYTGRKIELNNCIGYAILTK